MTVVAGIASAGGIILGADSFASGSDVGFTLAGPKVVELMVHAPAPGAIVKRTLKLLIGASGAPRIASTLKHLVTPPVYDDPSEDPERYVLRLIDVIRDVARARGLIMVRDGQEKLDGRLLIGFKGRLFVVSDDYDLLEPKNGMAAIGCADSVTLAAMLAFHRSGAHHDRYDVLQCALEVAAELDIHVRGPFAFVTDGEP